MKSATASERADGIRPSAGAPRRLGAWVETAGTGRVKIAVAEDGVPGFWWLGGEQTWGEPEAAEVVELLNRRRGVTPDEVGRIRLEAGREIRATVPD